MFQIVGIRKKSYSFDDGRKVDGFELHLTESQKDVDGVAVERQFVSMNRLDGYLPKLGDKIDVEWSRYRLGKIDRVYLVK